MLASQHYEHLVTLQDSRQVIDGYQVMAQRQALNDPLLPPIVILPAEHGRETLLKALAAGARDFIGKPFDMAEPLMRVTARRSPGTPHAA